MRCFGRHILPRMQGKVQVMANQNKPQSITTARYRRNLIISGVLLIAVIVAAGIFLATRAIDNHQEPSAIPFVPTQVQENKDAVVTDIQESTDTVNTPQEACNVIASYYKAIAEKDVKKLKDLGATGTATALSKNWLDEIGYKLDIGKVENPDASAFPASAGIYAGCTLYKISDFYSHDTSEAIESNVYGKKGAEGWVYYDPINVRWVIVDPTVPTAFASPAAENVERLSDNKGAIAKMSCKGVYSNPWWAWASSEVQLTNTSSDESMKVGVAKHDNGFTVNVAQDLLNGAAPASGGNSTVVKGQCAMWRGDTASFTMEKVGARPLEVDGDICPVVVTFGNENISPLFTVGKADASELADEAAEAQIEDYGATADFELVGNLPEGEEE